MFSAFIFRMFSPFFSVTILLILIIIANAWYEKRTAKFVLQTFFYNLTLINIHFNFVLMTFSNWFAVANKDRNLKSIKNNGAYAETLVKWEVLEIILQWLFFFVFEFWCLIWTSPLSLSPFLTLDWAGGGRGGRERKDAHICARLASRFSLNFSYTDMRVCAVFITTAHASNDEW